MRKIKRMRKKKEREKIKEKERKKKEESFSHLILEKKEKENDEYFSFYQIYKFKICRILQEREFQDSEDLIGMAIG